MGAQGTFGRGGADRWVLWGTWAADGHEAVPHGDQIDYLVNGRIHHPHNGHCDDHGPLTLA